MKLWDAFLENYADEINNWSLRYTLEAFWHYCQGGDSATEKFILSHNLFKVKHKK